MLSSNTCNITCLVQVSARLVLFKIEISLDLVFDFSNVVDTKKVDTPPALLPGILSAVGLHHSIAIFLQFSNPKNRTWTRWVLMAETGAQPILVTSIGCPWTAPITCLGIYGIPKNRPWARVCPFSICLPFVHGLEVPSKRCPSTIIVILTIYRRRAIPRSNSNHHHRCAIPCHLPSRPSVLHHIP